MERPLVIYHANCPDGFGAAVAAYCHFRQGDDCLCDFVAASFGQPPPEVSERQVYILDFSYARPVLKAMCRAAQTVTILDHHISAEKDLIGLEKEHANLRVVFDMDKSGSVLTWEFFHRTPPPQLLLLIQDRDLWRFALEGTNDLHAALQARPFDFQAWAALIDGGELPASLFAEGEAINRYRRERIALHRDKAVLGTIDGCQVPIVNCYDEIASDLLGELAEGHPFAVGYQDQGTLRKWSLRSSATGADVAEIATRFGGGGHQHAAGFITKIPEGLLHLSSQTWESGETTARPGGSPIPIQNARLHQDLAESKRLDEALNEIETILYSTKDCEVIMNKMLQLSTDVIGAESAVIFLKEGDRWLTRYVYKLSESLVGQSFSNTEVIHTAITAETKRSLVVQDVENSPEIDQKFVEMLRIRSLLDFPLILQGEVIGDLTFHYHSSPVSFTAKQVDFVRKLQISISLALENCQRRRSEQQLREKESFKQGILDSLPANIAVLDPQGIIIAVNRSWVLFAEENGLPDSSSVCAGVDYLAVCRKSADLSDPLALEALLGIEMVLNHKITDFTLKYPCHSPTSQRWFMMQVVRSNDMQGAVVSHLDITERIKVEKELQDANQELEAFNYSVAHDLRTPLNTLSLSCQAIEMMCNDLLDEECRGYVRNIYTSTLKMNQLIDALLTFSRMGHAEPQREKIDLCVPAQEVVALLQQTEPERQVDFRICAGIEANGDPRLLRVVLDNLIGNAWKYTGKQEKAVIEVGVSEIEGVPTYFVRDNGIGFDKAEADKLFVPFQRLPGAETSKGFGIGLATVERIIRRHGGRIWAEGEPGKGATFFFTLSAD